MDAFQNILFFVNQDIQQTKNGIEISIAKHQAHDELDDYLEQLEQIQKFLQSKNEHAAIDENEAVSQCKETVFDLVSNLMDTYGRWAGKEVLTSVLDDFNNNGYFT